MRRLMTGIRSEKCVVRRFRRCANVIECTYTNLDSIAYYTPRLYGIDYCFYATNLYSMLTHCGRVTQICVFNTVKLSTSASSP